MNHKFLIFIAGVLTLNLSYALDEAQVMDMLEAHNQYRADVDVPPLTWSAELATTAQAHADTLRDAHACNLVHSRTQGVGENLFWASARVYSSGKRKLQVITSQDVTDSWASERHDYSYATNSCAQGKVCGHYTQIVWETTQEIGCAETECADSSQVWVCQYSPAGNYIGEKPY